MALVDVDFVNVEFVNKCNAAKDDIMTNAPNAADFSRIFSKSKYEDIFELIKESKMARDFMVVFMVALSRNDIYVARINSDYMEQKIERIYVHDDRTKIYIQYIREFFTKCRMRKLYVLRPSL